MQRKLAEEVAARAKKLKGKSKRYYELLTVARGQIVEQYQAHTTEALNYNNNSSGESGVSTHMADQGSDNFQHDMDLSLLTNESEVLEQIEEAIERLFDKEYGECLDCGCDVNPERLEAKPWARFCIKCKSEQEKNGENW